MAQPKSFTLDGRRCRLDPQVPASAINWVVGRMHVGTSDDEVRKAIGIRCSSWPAKMVGQAQDYAVKCHRDNQRLYGRVVYCRG